MAACTPNAWRKRVRSGQFRRCPPPQRTHTLALCSKSDLARPRRRDCLPDTMPGGPHRCPSQPVQDPQAGRTCLGTSPRGVAGQIRTPGATDVQWLRQEGAAGVARPGDAGSCPGLSTCCFGEAVTECPDTDQRLLVLTFRLHNHLRGGLALPFFFHLGIWSFRAGKLLAPGQSPNLEVRELGI